MRISFPFAVKQVDDSTIEIVYGSGPLLTIDVPNPDLRKLVDDKTWDEIYFAAATQLVKAMIQVE